MRAVPPGGDAELIGRLDRIEHVLSATQDEVAKLSEDREFYQQLYSGRSAAAGE